MLVENTYVELERGAQTHRHPKMRATKAKSLQRAARAEVAATLHTENNVAHVHTITALNNEGHGLDIRNHVPNVLQLA